MKIFFVIMTIFVALFTNSVCAQSPAGQTSTYSGWGSGSGEASYGPDGTLYNTTERSGHRDGSGIKPGYYEHWGYWDHQGHRRGVGAGYNGYQNMFILGKDGQVKQVPLRHRPDQKECQRARIGRSWKWDADTSTWRLK